MAGQEATGPLEARKPPVWGSVPQRNKNFTGREELLADLRARITGKMTAPVTTGQIYWGAMPFVLIQVIMVVAVILFPAMVMHYKAGQSQLDPNKVQIDLPTIDLPQLDLH